MGLKSFLPDLPQAAKAAIHLPSFTVRFQPRPFKSNREAEFFSSALKS
jgi:hypothetical protein